jgi:hypothetical protein
MWPRQVSLGLQASVLKALCRQVWCAGQIKAATYQNSEASWVALSRRVHESSTIFMWASMIWPGKQPRQRVARWLLRFRRMTRQGGKSACIISRQLGSWGSVICLAMLGSGCSSTYKAGLGQSGGTTASATAASSGQGGDTAQGGTTVQGGTKVVGGTMISGGTSVSGTGGRSGSSGSQNVCFGRPSTCVALCQGGTACVCYCPSSGGAGGSSTASGGKGGTAGAGGTSSSGSGASCYDSGGAIATAAKACSLASDCKQVVEPTCCGAISQVGLAKSSACTFPTPFCGDLYCATSTYSRAEDGKNTSTGGTIGLQCVNGQCKTFVVAVGADAGTDAGQCPAGQMWCPGCTPGTGSCFAGGCPASACPPPDAGTNDAPSGSCDQVTTQAACDSRSDCHSVFVDPGTCGCALAGCCAHFNRCAGGGHADCSGPALCKMAQPFCEAPYVLSYTGSCYEGCVHQSACSGGDAAVASPTKQ